MRLGMWYNSQICLMTQNTRFQSFQRIFQILSIQSELLFDTLKKEKKRQLSFFFIPVVYIIKCSYGKCILFFFQNTTLACSGNT